MDPIEELDKIFSILENPIRRQIIKRLSESPNFALQLSKELQITQQLVAKHLRLLEENGLVDTQEQESPRGPKRKLYVLNRHLSLRVDMAPNLYTQELETFEQPEPPPQQDAPIEAIKTETDKLLRSPITSSMWKRVSQLLDSMDEVLERIARERIQVLFLRDQVMRYAGNAMMGLSPMERSVLIRLIENPRITLMELARQFNIRQEYIEELLEDLRGKGFLDR